MIDDGDERARRKRDRNARHYARSKATREQATLWLDKGGLARLDAAAASAQLSRAAFARLFLSPLVDAIGPRLASIDAARSERGQSFSRFVGLAIDAAVARPIETRASSEAAEEFDHLFGPAVDGGS